MQTNQVKKQIYPNPERLTKLYAIETSKEVRGVWVMEHEKSKNKISSNF